MEAQEARKPDAQGQRMRQPYERPALLWEEEFEPYVFSTCGKMPGQGGPCLAGMKQS